MTRVHFESDFQNVQLFFLMWVMPSNLERLVLPLRRQVNPYLPTVSVLGITQAEAGNRTQSEVTQVHHTGVNGGVAWVNKS